MAKKIITGPLTEKFNKDQLICLKDEFQSDLFIIHSGKILVFTEEGSKITPIAELKEGEYLGELSFFDRKPRSAHVIATEDSILVRIPIESINQQMPSWLYTIALSITEKIRHSDKLIAENGIKRKNVKTLKPLSVELQRKYLEIVNKRRQVS